MDQGGVGTLSARDRGGALPIHGLLGAPESPSRLECIKYLLKSFLRSVSMMTNDGDLPLHVACSKSAATGVLRILIDLDPATLQLPNATGALPVHLLCGT